MKEQRIDAEDRLRRLAAEKRCEEAGDHSWTEDMRRCWRCDAKPTEEEFNAAEAIREAEIKERRARHAAAKREHEAIESLERCWERNR